MLRTGALKKEVRGRLFGTLKCSILYSVFSKEIYFLGFWDHSDSDSDLDIDEVNKPVTNSNDDDDDFDFDFYD